MKTNYFNAFFTLVSASLSVRYRFRFILSFDFLLIVSEKRPLTRQAKSAIQDTIFDQEQVTGKIPFTLFFKV
jgi:hypothetical protein